MCCFRLACILRSRTAIKWASLNSLMACENKTLHSSYESSGQQNFLGIKIFPYLEEKPFELQPLFISTNNSPERNPKLCVVGNSNSLGPLQLSVLDENYWE